MRSGTIAFLAGITLFHHMPQVPAPAWLLLMPPVIVTLLLPVGRRFLLPGLLLGGFAWAMVHAIVIMPAAFPESLEGEDILVEGTVITLPEVHDYRQRFEVAVDTAVLGGKPVRMDGNLRLSWYRTQQQPGVGQRWRLLVRLKRPHGMANPGGMDYEAWLYERRIVATGYIRRSDMNRMLGDEPWSQPVQRLRQSMRERLRAQLGDSPVSGLIQALAIGVRGDMDNAQWQILTATGTNHLMAISGLHIGMVAGLVFALVSRLWRLRAANLLYLPSSKAGALGGLLAALLYAAMAGFAVPTQRALIMVAVVMAAIWLQRRVSPDRLLAMALLLVLLHDPLVPLSAGFWLSFAAVAVILYGMGARIGRVTIYWRWGRVQWLVALGLLPLMVIFFQKASLSAPLANLIAVPWMSFVVVPLTLAGTLLSSLPILSEPLLQLAALATEALFALLEWLAVQVPAMVLPIPPWWSYPLAVAGVVVMMAPRGIPLRHFGVVLVLPMLTLSEARPGAGTFSLTVLDVGQGLAMVVQTRNHLLLYDTGPSLGPGFDAAQATVIPYLRSQGTVIIDNLVLSHGDSDHAGGLQSVLEGLTVGTVMSSVPQPVGTIPQQRCEAGQTWHWDGVAFEILHPVWKELDDAAQENDASCVLRISNAKTSVLLTGDIEALAEQQLVERYGSALHSDVVQAPHHGSATSSTHEFIATVNPAWVIYSVGYRNRFGFPNDGVVARYAMQGTKALYTRDAGAIRVDFTEVLQITAYREQVRRYWHTQ